MIFRNKNGKDVSKQQSIQSQSYAENWSHVLMRVLIVQYTMSVDDTAFPYHLSYWEKKHFWHYSQVGHASRTAIYSWCCFHMPISSHPEPGLGKTGQALSYQGWGAIRAWNLNPKWIFSSSRLIIDTKENFSKKNSGIPKSQLRIEHLINWRFLVWNCDCRWLKSGDHHMGCRN